jgi:2-oxoglutarate ferredoxin oxidoreductase subunit delta
MWRKPLDSDKVIRPRGEIQVEISWCKGCQYCVEFCPTGVLELSKGFNAKGYHYPEIVKPELCVDCKLCERMCPEYCMVVVSLVDPTKETAKKAETQTDGPTVVPTAK